MGSDLKFTVALNRNYTDKVRPGDGRFWDFNMSFENVSLTMPQLVAAIRAGHAWTAPHRHERRRRPTRRNPAYRTTYRVKENVIHSQLLALDCDTEDERSTFYHLLQDPFIRKYAALLHETASSRPERPRTRIIFMLDEPVSAAEYGRALRALLFRYAYCDQSVNHPAVVFYGARECRFHLRELVLPAADLQREIIQPYADAQAAEKARRAEARAARLASAGGRPSAGADQVTAYVTAVYRGELDELAATPGGRGLRHKRLFTTALKLGSLQAAHWLTSEAEELLRVVEGRILDAAVQNGYVDDYGEDDALRTIENGVDLGRERPWDEPVWNAEYFPQPGMPVVARTADGVIARGHIAAFREGERGWEFRLEERPRVWFAQGLLFPAEAGERVTGS